MYSSKEIGTWHTFSLCIACGKQWLQHTCILVQKLLYSNNVSVCTQHVTHAMLIHKYLYIYKINIRMHSFGIVHFCS